MLIGLELIRGLLEALAGLETLHEAVEWLKLPEKPPLQRAIDRTASRFASTFPDLRRQLTDAVTSPALRATLESFLLRGTVDVRELVRHLATAGLYLPSEEDAASADEALRYFLEAFNQEVLKNPETGLVLADTRSASRDAALATELATLAAMTQRIEAAVRSDPGEELAALREAAATVDVAAAVKMYELFERRHRRAGTWSRELEAQVQVEIGAVAWRSGDAPTAARYFERAYDLDPREQRIQVNSALALAVKKAWPDALDRLESVIRNAPDNARAKTAKAQVLQMEGRTREALDVLRPITAEQGADADAYRLHVGAAISEVQFDEAVAVAERGLPGRDDAVCLAALGMAYAARADASYRAGRLDEAARNDQAHARDAYTRAIAAARLENSPRVLRESLVSLAHVLLQSTEPDAALAYAREARALDPQNSHAALSLSSIALATRHFDEAFSVAEPLAKDGNDQAKALAFAAFCGMNPSAATQRLEELLQSLGVPLESAAYPIFDLIVDAALRESTIVADAIAARWTGGTPSERALVDARLALAAGNRTLGLQRAQEALEAIKVNPDAIAAFRLGELSSANDAPALAVRAYELIPVTETSPEFMVAAYMNALLALEDAEGEPKVLAFASRVAAAGAFSPPVAHAEATIQEHRGELERAQQLWGALAAQSADRGAKYYAAVARCAYRRGRIGDAAAALGAIKSREYLTAPDLLIIAELRRRLGEHDRALSDAYAALKKAPQDPTVGFNYLVFFMGLPQHITANTVRDAVTEGVVVTLEFARGEEHAVAIGTETLAFDASRYNATSPEAQLLFGKKLGDVLTWATGPAGPVEARIKEISDPRRFAARRLLTNIQHRFPGKSPIAAVEVGERFEGAKRILAEQSAEDDSLVEFAKSNPVPFALLAKRLGRDLYRVWASLEAIPFKILVSTNTDQDIRLESASLASAKGVVLDPLALLDLRALGLLERVAARFSKLIVAQASIDVLRECRDALADDSARGELLTVGVRNGDLAPTVISKAQLESAVGFISDILAFCDTKCERAGRPRPFTQKETELVDVFTEAFLVPMMIAGERARADIRLLSDDAVVRALAREVCGAAGFSVLSLIDAELASGTLSLDAYSDLMRSCLPRMRHATLRAEYLTHLVVSSRPLIEYAGVIDALLDPDLPRDPNLRVAFAHVRQVAIQAVVWENATEYLQMLFMRTAKRHGRAALAAIKKALRSPNLIMVPNVERAIRLISLCEQATWDPDTLLV